MPAPERYGKLSPPEKTARIEVIEDPVQAARAAYRAWHPVAQAGGFRACADVQYDAAACDTVYREAAALLAPHAKLFRQLTPDQLSAIRQDFIWDDEAAPGIFLSALLNETELPELDGVFKHHILGYRLAPGKRIFTRAGSDVFDLCRYAQGELINFGFSSHAAQSASAGVQANFTDVNLLAYAATGGVQLNFGLAKWDFAKEVTGGIQLNFGAVSEDLAWHASGGIQANYLRADSIADGAKGGLQLNFAKAQKDYLRWYETKRTPKSERLLGELTQKLHTLDGLLLQRWESIDACIDIVRKCDWRTFEAEASELAKRIEEAYTYV